MTRTPETLAHRILKPRPLRPKKFFKKNCSDFTQDQIDCVANFDACAEELGVTKKLIGDWGGFDSKKVKHRHGPDLILQMRVASAIKSLRKIYNTAPRPQFEDFDASCALACALIRMWAQDPSPDGFRDVWKPSIIGFLEEIRANGWWWTRLPIFKKRCSHQVSQVRLALVESEILQSYGGDGRELFSIGPALADKPEACQSLSLRPPQ